MAKHVPPFLLTLALLSCLTFPARGQGDGVRAEPGTWGAPLRGVTNPAPTERANHKGVLIRYPAGADNWVDEAKLAIDTTATELANFGIKLAPDITVYLVGSPQEFAKVTGRSTVPGRAWWNTTPVRVVAHEGPASIGEMVGGLATGIAGISAYAHQSQNPFLLPGWQLHGLQSRVEIANAARVVGVPETETELYRFLVDRTMDAIDRESRASGLEMLADKPRQPGSRDTEVELPMSLLHGLLPLIAPSPTDKAEASKHRAFCELVGGWVRSENESREKNPQELRLVAQQLVKVLEIEKWFKEASKSPETKQQLAKLGIDVDSPAFKAALKDTELDYFAAQRKQGKKEQKPPEPGTPEARFSGGKFGALFEAYAVHRVYLANEHVKAARAKAKDAPPAPGAGGGEGKPADPEKKGKGGSGD